MRWKLWSWPECSMLEDVPSLNKRKPQYNRFNVFWLVSCVCVFISTLYILSHQTPRMSFNTILMNSIEKNIKREVVKSAGCHVPELHPWDPSILPYILKIKPFNCSEDRLPPLVASNITSLYIVRSAVLYYNTNVWCCYQPCLRAKRTDNKLVRSEYCYRFSYEVRIKYEFVIVHCYEGWKKVYEDYHTFVPRKPHVEKRCEELASRSPSFRNSTFSVLILGLDAVSRLNLHRQMPLTVALLKKMGAVEMLEYNKVGDNTFPNLVPVLTGMDVQQLRNSCWHHRWSFFDNCPFVWNEYRDAGFRTVFAEESSEGIFTYLMKGFAKQPTDYYTHHFIKAMLESIGRAKMIEYLCSGSRLTTEVYLHYVKQIATTFKFERYFAFFWSSTLSHDSLNILNLADKIYEKFLLELQATQVLERTVLAVISDHGLRNGQIRLTYQGRLEERLPSLFLVFPESFRKAYPIAVANVERNAHQLTTHFDLHETLRDLMQPSKLLSKEMLEWRFQVLNQTARSFNGLPRGISVFLPVPSTRTCKQAGINAHFCTCLNGTPVDRNDIMYNRTAHYLVEHINQHFENFPQCHLLDLDRIYEVNKQSLPDDKGTYIAYLVVVETKPGGAQFEGTMHHDRKSNKLSVVGSVSRINLYGKQSWCVGDMLLKLYCFCKRQPKISKNHNHRNFINKLMIKWRESSNNIKNKRF